MAVSAIILNAFGAITVAFFLFSFTLVVTWFMMTAFYMHLTDSGTGNTMVTYTLIDLVTYIAYGPFLFIGAAGAASIDTVSAATNNAVPLIVAFLFIGGSFVMMAYMDVVVYNITIYYQLLVRPIFDFLILPFFNIIRTGYNIIIGVYNLFWNLVQFAIYGAPSLFFTCSTQNFKFANLVEYLLTLAKTIFQDFANWVKSNPLKARYNILNSLIALGNVANIFLPTFNCFCQMLDFFWQYILTILNLASLHKTIDNIWNIFIGLLQVLPSIFFSPGYRPNFVPLTITSCLAVEDAGDVVEQIILLTAQVTYGIITQKPNLPPIIGQFLTVNYTSIVTHPICALIKLANMTLTGAVNIEIVFQAHGGILAYLQFGFLFDELKTAWDAFCDLFVILNVPSLVALLKYIGYAIIDIVSIYYEFVIGGVVGVVYGINGTLPASFELYGVPITNDRNIWLYFTVDYWIKAMPLNTTGAITVKNYTYSSALQSAFYDVQEIDLAIGNLIGLANVPLGLTIRYFLNSVVGLLKFVINIIAYSYNLFLFQYQTPMPTSANWIDLTYFYEQTFFLAGAAGDIFRQLVINSTTNCNATLASAAVPGTDSDRLFFCSIGNFIETFFDFVILVVQQITDFIQDTLTFFQGLGGGGKGILQLCIFGNYDANIQLACIRIPNFQQSIRMLSTSLCAASNAITGLIPDSISFFTCRFKFIPNSTDPGNEKTPIPLSCNRIQTCMGQELCTVLQFFLILPLDILNALFVSALTKNIYKGTTSFITFVIRNVVDQAVLIFENLGLLLDCFVCAFGSGDKNQCLSPIYGFFLVIGKAVRTLANAVNDAFLNFFKLVVLFIVGLFNGNPITATIDFIVGLLTDVGVALGESILNFILSLLSALNLSFLSGFITVLYKGLCYTLQVILNVILIALRLLTFGYVNKQVNFCCGLDKNCTVSGLKRYNSFDGLEYIDAEVDNWLMHLADLHPFPLSDACNATITTYKHYNWTQLDDFQQGNVMYCYVKKIWLVRTDNQKDIGNSRCDHMVIGYTNNSWSDLSVNDKSKLIECMNMRLYMEALREVTNLTWIPQDLMTNPFRKWYFGAEMIRGYLINYQFMSDRTKPPTVILTQSYQDYFKNLGLDVEIYKNLTTVSDVMTYQNTSHLQNYFIANNATQYDAVIYTSTGAWSIVNTLIKGFYNASIAMSDNVTNPATYLGLNYSVNNSMGGTVSALFGVFAEIGGMISSFAEYWKDPNHYKKRVEAYAQFSEAGYILYHESISQIRLMSAEALGKEKDSPFAHTCSTKAECDAAGVTAFAEEYRKSMRGEDALRGETSIVYKIVKWWERLDFTTYPIEKTRYPTPNPDSYSSLSYRHENGTILNESLKDRFYRYLALVNKGTPASNMRWTRMAAVLNYTRDTVYTKVLKSFYGDADYKNTEHHQYMTKRHTARTRVAYKSRISKGAIKGTQDCNVENRECSHTFDFSESDYDTPSAPGPINLMNEQDMFEIKSAMMSTETVALKNEPLVDMWLYTAKFFTPTPVTTVNIPFPCAKPLNCSGGNITTLAVQCLYLQMAIDRVVGATNTLLGLYSPNGQFYASLNATYQFFGYTYITNATVVVGDSANLSVSEFPAYGATFLESFSNSMRYFGDDTPNKTRFNEFIADSSNQSNISNPVYSNSSLFSIAQPGTFNYYVFWITEHIFYKALRFFDNLILTVFSTNTPTSSVLYQATNELLFCNYTTDLLGQTQRFAVGEIVVMGLLIFLPGITLLIFLFGFDPLMIIVGSGLGIIIFTLTLLVLFGDTAYLCAGLPPKLGDGIFYAFAFNFFPKCPWYFGALWPNEYNNDNCYDYNSIVNMTPTNCFLTEGFFDIFYLLVFFFQFYAPSVLNFFRTSTIPPFPTLYSLPFFSSRINYFVNVDLQNPRIFARYMNCAWQWALPLNFSVFAAGAYTIAIFGPAAAVFVYTLFIWILGVAQRVLLVLWFVGEDLLTNPGLIPSGYDDDDDDDNENENQQETGPSQSIQKNDTEIEMSDFTESGFVTVKKTVTLPNATKTRKSGIDRLLGSSSSSSSSDSA